MKEEEIDKLLKNKMNNNIKAPENLKKRISYEIKNINESNRKNKKVTLKVMQSIAAMAVISILGVTTYATVTKNPILEKLGLIKGSTTYEEVAKEINEDISNEYAKITLKRMASDNAYVIMQYNVNLNKKGIEEFGGIETDEFSGYNIGIINKIKINNEEIDISFNTTEYVSRISDTEYDIYQIIEIANIDSKNLKIEISEDYLIGNDNQTDINKTVIIEATKNKNTETFKKTQKKIENKTITIENFQNTSFETFIKASIDVEDLSKEDIQDVYSERNPENISLTVIDNENNYIPNICYMKKLYVEDKYGNVQDILSGYQEDDKMSNNNLKAHIEYIITLGDIDKQINEIKLMPYISILTDERGEYDEYYNNLKWYKLQDGEYSQKNSVGGELKINKIEITDEKIKFEYDLKGVITGNENPVLLRINDERLGFNVIYPTNTYIEKINSESNYTEFNRNMENVGIYDSGFKNEEDYKLKDLDKIEFTLLEQYKIIALDEIPHLKVPEEKDNYLIINKVEVKEIENNTIIENADENIYKTEKFGKKDNKIGNIIIGMTENEVKELLGEPKDITYNNDGYIENEDNFMYQYEGNLNIAFKSENGRNIVYLINTYRTQDEGPRGIKVGDEKNDIIKSFYHNDTINKIDEYNKEIYNIQNKYYGTIYSQSDNTISIEYGGDELLLNIYLDKNEKVKGMTLEVNFSTYDYDSSNDNNDENLNSVVLDTLYSKNGIEFKYPSIFKQTDDTFDKSGFEAIEDNEGNRFQIQDENITNLNTLNDIVEREKNLEMPDGNNYRTVVKKEEYITLPSGLEGYRFECKTIDNAYQIMFIAQKDNLAYYFSFSIADKEKYNYYVEILNEILKTLKVL